MTLDDLKAKFPKTYNAIKNEGKREAEAPAPTTPAASIATPAPTTPAASIAPPAPKAPAPVDPVAIFKGYVEITQNQKGCTKGQAITEVARQYPEMHQAYVARLRGEDVTLDRHGEAAGQAIRGALCREFDSLAATFMQRDGISKGEAISRIARQMPGVHAEWVKAVQP